MQMPMLFIEEPGRFTLDYFEINSASVSEEFKCSPQEVNNVECETGKEI